MLLHILLFLEKHCLSSEYGHFNKDTILDTVQQGTQFQCVFGQKLA